MDREPTYTAFAAARRGLPLVFEDQTGKQVDFDLRGAPAEALARALPAPFLGPGRPRLGVVSREISLLPRHWEWLEEQPNGASAALGRLVDKARKHEPAKQRRAPRHRCRRARPIRARRQPAELRGGLPRPLREPTANASNRSFAKWPAAIRAYALRLTETAF